MDDFSARTASPPAAILPPLDRALATTDAQATALRIRKKRVVVVGGGFGGLAAVKGLRGQDLHVTLIDSRNYHLFQPLLYQVATAALSPADIAEPIRRILRDQKNVQVLLGTVSAIDLERRTVRWDKGAIEYDYLVLAAGATHAYFGRDEWAVRAPGLKTADDALEIRRRLLLAFESAEMEDDAEASRAELTFVVVGGGPTGVELAGALREIALESIPRDFRRVDTTSARVVLVEGQSRLLPTMSTTASERAHTDLEKLGVEVRLQTLVTEVEDEWVVLSSGEQKETLPTRNIIWAAGVQAAPLTQSLGVPLDRAGRILVGPDCSIPDHPEVFAIGDVAAITDPATGRPVPGVAQGALQMGHFVARRLRALVAGEGTEEARFTYRDKGSMATIGRGKAVVDMGRRSYGGLLAWFLWCVVHVTFLVSFRNKVFVVAGWIWNYLAQVKGARLITGRSSTAVKRPVEF